MWNRNPTALLLAGALTLPAGLAAQQWVDLMMDPDVNVHQVQDAFEQYWGDKTYEKGKGWKQFKRWEWFMEPRTYPSGERFDLAAYARAWKEVGRMERAQGAKSATWTPLGPTTWQTISYNPGNGRVNCVAVDPQVPTTIYVGTPSGGLWRSTDDGSTWSPLFTELPSLGVSGIAIDPNDTDVIYVASGDGDGADTYSLGVLKSTDGGASWQTTGLDWDLTQARTTRALLMHPTDPQTLFCATSNGLWKTVNGGADWTQVAEGGFRDIAFKPGDPSIVYATTDQFHRSTDGGSSFTLITSGLPADDLVNRMALAVSPDDPGVVYVLAGREDDSGFRGLYRSTNSGLQFNLRSNSPNLFGYQENGADNGGQSWYDMALAADPGDAQVVYVGGINVWKSTNGGSDWTIKSHWVYPSQWGYTHADIHCLEVFNGQVLCGSDGGIHRSFNGANDWFDLSAGLDIMQFYRFGGSEVMPSRVIGGAQDNGTNLLDNGVWTHVFGADGMEAAVDPVDPDIVYGSFQNGGILRSFDAGQNFSNIGNGIPEDGPWVTPYVIDHTDPQVLFAGFENLWKSTDRGDNWTAISNWSPAPVRYIALAPSNSDHIYVSRTDFVRHSSTGGIPWTDISGGLPDLAVTSLAVHPLDPEVVYCTLSGFAANEKVYVSSDAGQTWTNISANLPNVPMNSIVFQPGSAGGVYVGSDMGVFYTDSTLSNWQPFGQGLPNVVVTELEINQTAGKLRAATYGRGLWESDLYAPSGLPPQALFVHGSAAICAGDAIVFNDASLEAAPGWDWQFPGGDPAVSSDPSPTVLYASPGTYSVSLTMSNPFGSDTHTAPVIVTVLPHEMQVAVVVDDYPEETTWTITSDLDGSVVASGGPYNGAASGSVRSDTLCLPDGCYQFTIMDSYGDGICCGFGNGSYTVFTDQLGNFATGGNFDFEESTPFCVSTSVGIGEVAGLDLAIIPLTDGLYSLRGTIDGTGRATLEVFDAMGRRLQQRALAAQELEGTVVDLRALATGAYVVRITSGPAGWTGRVLR